MDDAVSIDGLLAFNASLCARQFQWEGVLQTGGNQISQLLAEKQVLLDQSGSLGETLNLLQQSAMKLESNISQLAAFSGAHSSGVSVLDKIEAVVNSAAKQAGCSTLAQCQLQYRQLQAQWQANHDAATAEAGGGGGSWLALGQTPATSSCPATWMALDAASSAAGGDTSSAGGVLALEAPPLSNTTAVQAEGQSEITPCTRPPQQQQPEKDGHPTGPPPRKGRFNRCVASGMGRLLQASKAISAGIRGGLHACLPACMDMKSQVFV